MKTTLYTAALENIIHQMHVFRRSYTEQVRGYDTETAKRIEVALTALMQLQTRLEISEEENERNSASPAR